MTVIFAGCSSRYEAELAVFVESFSSSSTNRGSKYSLSHALFSETVYKVVNQMEGPGWQHLVWLRATCINSAITVLTASTIF